MIVSMVRSCNQRYEDTDEQVKKSEIRIGLRAGVYESSRHRLRPTIMSRNLCEHSEHRKQHRDCSLRTFRIASGLPNGLTAWKDKNGKLLKEIESD